MHLSSVCNFRTSLLMVFIRKDSSRRCWSFQALQCSVFPNFSSLSSCTLKILSCPHDSTNCKDFLWSQFVSKCLHPLLFLWDETIHYNYRAAVLDKSKFEGTILVRALTSLQGPFCFGKKKNNKQTKNKGIVSTVFCPTVQTKPGAEIIYSLLHCNSSLSWIESWFCSLVCISFLNLF